jgi:hypothetical protein
MSMTLANADLYISRILGGASNTETKAQARDSLKATMEMWSLKNNWHFLLQDTSQTFTVATCSVPSPGTPSTTVNTTVTNGFANVLKGMTVTGAGVPAGTTVDSVTDTDTIVLSVAVDLSAAALTFSGTIPIIAGTARYKLPTRFHKPYVGGARLISNVKTPLRFVRRGFADMVMADPTVMGAVTHYTIESTPTDFNAGGTQQEEINLIRVPEANDVLLFKYYRPMDGTKDPVDVKETYLYTLLDHARIHLLFSKNSTDSRLPGLIADIRPRLADAISDDRREAGEDEMEGFVTPTELGLGTLGIEFYPRGDR